MGCNHDCASCSQSCGGEQDLHEPLNNQSTVKHVIGVVSGKGGVGKSMVTAQLAVALSRAGKKVAILDADITGPSIPKSFGIHEKAMGSEMGIFPAVTETGIELMSINLLLKEETDPVVWRSPMIVGTVKQFWSDVIWGDVDYMLVDMPPGTGDIPLTVFQSLPLDGIIVVASPQELVSMIVENEDPRSRLSREHELLCLPRLRQASQRIRRQQDRRDCRPLRHAGHRKAADRPRACSRRR